MMVTQTVFYDTRDLPPDVLTLIDDQFYDFVQGRLGEYQSSLLKLQEINSVPCFLLTDDPCQVLNLNIDDNEVKLLKRHVCFSLSDGSFVVKPGVRTGFKCLRDILTKKTEEKLKQAKATKPQVTPGDSMNSSPSLSVSMPPVTAIAPAPLLAPVPSGHSHTSSSIVEHRKYFLDRLKRWCGDHQHELSIDNFDLQDGEDFDLQITSGLNGDVEAYVRCKCDRRVNLSIKERKIQLSNFQKHLRATNCSHVRAIQKRDEERRNKHTQQSIMVASPTSATALSSPTATRQSIVQSAVLLPSRASSTILAPSSSASRSLSSTEARKRVLRSSQSSPSRRTKRSRA